MSLNIVPEDINGKADSLYEYDRDPDFCPVCHRHIKPKRYIASSSPYNFGYERLQIIFRCTNANCDNLFIATYVRDTTISRYSPVFQLNRLSPLTAQETNFSETIEKLSPSFIEIYNQAIEAESSELNQIAGMGLRKALEFLIKDFAIDRNPNDAQKIKETALGNIIKNYVDDPRLKDTAERATWLGNDETHYVRKWADKDITDLKLLIKLSVNWIENVLLTEQYASNMPK
jgi:Domain of unknown function (DUF4145)